VPVVIGETQKETQPVFDALAKVNTSKIVYADQVIDSVYASDMIGSYQSKNIKTALQTIKELQCKGYVVSKENIEKGFLSVVENTGLLGRWQILQQLPKVVCDTGHNKEGLTYVMQQLQKEDFKHLHIVFGVVKDKDLSSIADLLPQTATYYFCKPNIPRGKNAETLQHELEAFKLKGACYNSVNEAYKTALENATKDDFIFIGGSTFVVAEII